MEFQPIDLICADCSANFVFSVGEQQFFAARNLSNRPKRCPNCRLTMRYARTGKDVKQLSEVECADCKRSTKVPFKPKGIRPVYCNDCLALRRSPQQTEVSELEKQLELMAASLH